MASQMISTLGLMDEEGYGIFMSDPTKSKTMVSTPRGKEPAGSFVTVVFQPHKKGPWLIHPHSDSIIAWHQGPTHTVDVILSDGSYQQVKMGDPVTNRGAKLIHIVPAGSYMAEENMTDSYQLLSYVTAPESQVENYPDKNELLAKFPQHAGVINNY